MLLKVINTELQFVFFDSVWATEVRPTCRVNEIKHLRGNVRKYTFALVLVENFNYIIYIFQFLDHNVNRIKKVTERSTQT